MPRPMAAGVFGMQRTMAVPAGNPSCRNFSVLPAMIETATVDGVMNRASDGITSDAACGLTAMMMTAA